MRLCTVEGCGRKHSAKGQCRMHYKRIKRPRKTWYHPNRIFVRDGYAEIELLHKDSTISFAQIDIEDVEKVSAYRWVMAHGYVKKNRPSEYLHQFLIGKQTGYVNDHINRDPLDNRKSNLRFLKHSENLCNRGLPQNNTSGYKGVSFSNKRGKWCSFIHLKNIAERYVGTFNNPVDAAVAYNNAMKKYVGDVAWLNQA